MVPIQYIQHGLVWRERCWSSDAGADGTRRIFSGSRALPVNPRQARIILSPSSQHPLVRVHRHSRLNLLPCSMASGDDAPVTARKRQRATEACTFCRRRKVRRIACERRQQNAEYIRSNVAQRSRCAEIVKLMARHAAMSPLTTVSPRAVAQARLQGETLP
jgi:hypothetical protein